MRRNKKRITITIEKHDKQVYIDGERAGENIEAQILLIMQIDGYLKVGKNV